MDHSLKPKTVVRYHPISQLFHWLTVALILVQFTWAWRIDQAEGFRVRFELVTQHKSLGMAVLVLVVLRLIWRFIVKPPPLPAHRPSWERRAAAWGHGLLYALILAMPLSGWAYSSAAGLGDFWWGPINWPSLVGANEALEDILKRVHQTLGILLGVVAGGHAVVALRHHLILKDEILLRMLPGRMRKGQD
jgi:cytochrome b561